MRIKIFTFVAFFVLFFGITSATHIAYASTPTAAVWIGSPFHGTWPNTQDCYPSTRYPSDYCSLPKFHHVLWYNGGYIDDFAMDLQNVAPGTGVFVYAAPKINGTPVTAVVDNVGYACRDKVYGDGGMQVTVAFYSGSTRIGAVVYAHIKPSVTAGTPINRWGGEIGTVQSYRYGTKQYPNGCWGGPHVHVEMSSQHNYACYSNYWQPGQWMNPSNFIGYIGGNYAHSGQQACPNGA